MFSGITANNAVQLYKDFAAALPDAKLYGPDGVAESGFADPKEGGIPADVASKVKVTVATLSPDEYPPEGQEFFDDFEEKYGEPNPDPYAIYGYEAASLALDAIERSGTGSKEDVLEALFDTKDRESVLGTYSIDENGDTTLTDYGVYTIDGGELTFDSTIKAAGQLIRLTDCTGGWEEIPAPGGRLLKESRTNMEAASVPAERPAAPGQAARRLRLEVRPDRRPARDAGLFRDPGPHGRRGQPHPPRQQPRRRPVQRRDLGARRDRLHARLRHRRADQLRPRRGLHDRLVRRRRASSARSASRQDTGTALLVIGLLLDAAGLRCSRSGTLNVMIERVGYRPLRSRPSSRR